MKTTLTAFLLTICLVITLVAWCSTVYVGYNIFKEANVQQMEER